MVNSHRQEERGRARWSGWGSDFTHGQLQQGDDPGDGLVSRLQAVVQQEGNILHHPVSLHNIQGAGGFNQQRDGGGVHERIVSNWVCGVKRERWKEGGGKLTPSRTPPRVSDVAEQVSLRESG